jgi:hypothetical protein
MRFKEVSSFHIFFSREAMIFLRLLSLMARRRDAVELTQAADQDLNLEVIVGTDQFPAHCRNESI